MLCSAWHCFATSVLPFAASLCGAYFCFVLCSALLWPALRSFGFRCFALLAFLSLCAKCFRLVRHVLLCLLCIALLCCDMRCVACFGFAWPVPGKPPGLFSKPSVFEKPCVFKERRFSSRFGRLAGTSAVRDAVAGGLPPLRRSAQNQLLAQTLQQLSQLCGVGIAVGKYQACTVCFA